MATAIPVRKGQGNLPSFFSFIIFALLFLFFRFFFFPYAVSSGIVVVAACSGPRGSRTKSMISCTRIEFQPTERGPANINKRQPLIKPSERFWATPVCATHLKSECYWFGRKNKPNPTFENNSNSETFFQHKGRKTISFDRAQVLCVCCRTPRIRQCRKVENDIAGRTDLQYSYQRLALIGWKIPSPAPCRLMSLLHRAKSVLYRNISVCVWVCIYINTVCSCSGGGGANEQQAKRKS